MAAHTEREGRTRWTTSARTPGYVARHVRPEPVTTQTIIIPAVQDNTITTELTPVPA